MENFRSIIKEFATKFFVRIKMVYGKSKKIKDFYTNCQKKAINIAKQKNKETVKPFYVDNNLLIEEQMIKCKRHFGTSGLYMHKSITIRRHI